MSYKSYRPEREKELIDKLTKNMAKAAFLVEGEAKRLVAVDTGRLRASIASRVETEDSEIVGVIGTNVEYACVVGSRHQVYEPMLGTSANIGNYPYDDVLSKDGQSHSIIKKHRFSANPIPTIAIKTRKGRNPLLVTDNHMVLIYRGGQIIWESANSINQTDKVFGKRSHNAITDNSNKSSYLCFCGQIFWANNYKLGYREPKYCSIGCRHKYGRHDFTTGRHWQLSEESKEKHRGENNPQWRDGSGMKPYDYCFNGQLKAIVKERDGFQCQICGSPFDLVVHHKDEDKMNSSLDNLITVCRQCHGKFNKQDCELPEVNLTTFVPKPILNLSHIIIKRKDKESVPRLYDFTIDNENSFMVGGILIHNSFQEFGTSKMPAHPFLYPALEGNRTKIQEILKE